MAGVEPEGSAGSGERVPRRVADRHRLAVVSAAVVVLVLAALGVALATSEQDRVRPSAAAGTSAPAREPAPGITADGASDDDPGPADPGADTDGGDPGSATTEAPEEPRRLTLAFAGDLLPHGPVNEQAARYGAERGVAYDYAPMLAPMAPILEPVDVALCHMEVVVAPAGEPVTSYPAFGAPAELVDGARSAGYDGCSNASNHSLDRGQAGIAATLERFDQVGLRHTGIARSAEEAAATTTYDVGGATVAHLSYAYGFNGYELPADAPWAANPLDPARVAADAAKARQGGADLVVVSIHWGDEYRSEPSRYQRDVAAEILPSPDIDLVIGHHAHVVQPIEQVEGTYVVWGLGNQLSNQTQTPRRDGLTVVVTAERRDDRWAVSGIEAVPTWVDLGSFRVLPVVPTMADPATPAALREELAGSYDRTVGIVTAPGTPGVTVAPEP